MYYILQIPFRLNHIYLFKEDKVRASCKAVT